ARGVDPRRVPRHAARPGSRDRRRRRNTTRAPRGLDAIPSAPSPSSAEVRMARRFSGKVVFITGASRLEGIGAAAAQRFADARARVAIAARGAAGLEAVAARIRDRGGDARAFPADLSDPAACEAVLRAVDEAFGGLDVLVNNAGANVRGAVEKQDPAALA